MLTNTLTPTSMQLANPGLGQALGAPVVGQALADAHWVLWSRACAQDLGWPLIPDHDMLALLGGQTNPIQSMASVYSGHQFGVWAGQLGDGRAMLLGQVNSQELALKGAGPTPYSRGGDGRAVLRSSLREFWCSEAMAALGIASTRALCVVGSSLGVQRETLETAAVLTRVAKRFIRFGHFEHFAHTQPNPQALQWLCDEVIRVHDPAMATHTCPALSLLQSVAQSTAELIAAWQAVGFCHGVMNTDNMSMLGLTLDYGPFGFLDVFDPTHVCNHSDSKGRYAFNKQPQVAFWNLHALAQAMRSLLPDTQAAIEAIQTYPQIFSQAYQARMRAKLGLQTEQAGDADLVAKWLELMADDGLDYTNTWRALAAFKTTTTDEACMRHLFKNQNGFDAWAGAYRQRLQDEGSIDAVRAERMNRVNPKYVLRNHLAQAAIEQAEQGDFSQARQLLALLSQPYDEQPEHEAQSQPPPQGVFQPSISCSS
jgi:serine/tyrosine/threonine adenylyltransferase